MYLTVPLRKNNVEEPSNSSNLLLIYLANYALRWKYTLDQLVSSMNEY